VTRYYILTCAKKLAVSQQNLPHGTKTVKIMKRTKNKTPIYLKRCRPHNSQWGQSCSYVWRYD